MPANQASSVFDVRPWATFRHYRKDHVAATIAHHAGLGESGVRCGLIKRIAPCFPGVLATLAAFDEVTADVVRLEPSAIDSDKPGLFFNKLGVHAQGDGLS